MSTHPQGILPDARPEAPDPAHARLAHVEAGRGRLGSRQSRSPSSCGDTVYQQLYNYVCSKCTMLTDGGQSPFAPPPPPTGIGPVREIGGAREPGGPSLAPDTGRREHATGSSLAAMPDCRQRLVTRSNARLSPKARHGYPGGRYPSRLWSGGEHAKGSSRRGGTGGARRR